MTDEVTDQGNPNKFFSLIPNIIDDLGLDPFERALYTHYKRACGADNKICRQGMRRIGKHTGMSIAQVSRAKDKLAKKGLIKLGEAKEKAIIPVTILDIWPLNFAYYSYKNRPDIFGWNIEQLETWVKSVSGGNSSTPSVTQGNSSDSHMDMRKQPNEVPSVSGGNSLSEICYSQEQKKELSKKEPKKPLPNGNGGKPPPRPDQLIFSALAELCQINLKLLTSPQRHQLNQTGKKLRDAGIEPEQISKFEAWWYVHDWRGEKNEPPTPVQVREVWEKFARYCNGTYPTSSPRNTNVHIVPKEPNDV